MIKIGLFTTDINQIATKFYYELIRQNKNFNLEIIYPSLINQLKKYQLIIIPPYKKEYNYIKKIRSLNPKICLLDPRNKFQASKLRKDDFCIIDSVEQYDLVSRYSENLFIYHEYPLFEKETIDFNKNPKEINIFYHGNKVHLNSSRLTLIKAISQLEKEYKINFHLCYNIKKLGLFETNLSSVIHHQWHENIYKELAQKMDIGVCPNLIPIKLPKIFKKLLSQRVDNSDVEDYIHRFKIPSNPGRIISMIMMGLPIIADMYPSACQIINHTEDGFLVSHKNGWYNALKKYILSKDLRFNHATKLQKKFNLIYSPSIQNKNLEITLKRFLLER
tara:strand:- start:1650 stop:2648 length:999 start_codon:yes stop_codon:yes gene_type:complete